MKRGREREEEKVKGRGRKREEERGRKKEGGGRRRRKRRREEWQRWVMHSRYLIQRVKDRLLEAVTEGAEVLDGVSNSHPHFLMFQGLVIGHIIW